MTSIVNCIGQGLGAINLHPPKDDCAEELARQADEEWEKGNANVIAFYKQNLPSLDNVNYEDVKAVVTYTVADSFSPSDWRPLATALGIPDSELGGIEESARIRNLKPLYVALDNAYPKLEAFCKKTSFGHLIRTLMTMERIDVLTKIKPKVQGLLSKASKPYSTMQPQRMASVQQDRHSDTLDSKSHSCMDSGFISTTASMAGDAEPILTEVALPLKDAHFENFANPNGDCISNCIAGGLDIQPACNEKKLANTCSDTDKYASVLDSYFPKGNCEKLTVFVTHHEDDYEVSTQLAKQLRNNYSCSVLVQGDLVGAYHCDQRIYEDLVGRADAIVPVLSKTYLANYDKPRRQGCADSLEASATYEVYYHLSNRLVADAFLCHMIFPVRLGDVDYADVRHHHIFKKACQLWDQVPKLVRIMHGCKDMVRNRRNGHVLTHDGSCGHLLEGKVGLVQCVPSHRTED
ncbi:uncharacterized protein LOC135394168 isoform X2 [Ornithodoros turicata]|uniref:uncharacterized protein LOC135394168 isoform X2 n=1 Tax=Ornithodoros turicata TaxID=34597 RepID=UPI003139AA30